MMLKFDDGISRREGEGVKQDGEDAVSSAEVSEAGEACAAKLPRDPLTLSSLEGC